MEQRNAVALVALVALGVFAAYYVATASGLIPEPGVEYMNVKLTTGVDCGLGWMCWFSDTISLQHTTGYAYSFLNRPMQWFCGWGGTPSPIKATLTVQDPAGSVEVLKKEQTSCSAQDVVFFWNLPLRTAGTYKVTAEVCGDTYWWTWSCKTDSFTYTRTG